MNESRNLSHPDLTWADAERTLRRAADEHRHMVTAQVSASASYSGPSAEGITLWGGLESHDGDLIEIVQQGKLGWTARYIESKKDSRQID